MRVLLVHNRYRSSVPGGEDRVVDQECAALLAEGHSVERFERSNDEIRLASLADKALVGGRVLWSEKTRRSLGAQLHSFSPEVVHVHNTFPLLSPSILHACRAARVPVVATVHHYRMVCPSGDLFRDGAICHDCVARLPLPAVRHGCYHDSRLATMPLVLSSIAHARAWRKFVSAYIFLSRAQREIFSATGLPPDRMFVKPNFIPDPPGVTAPRGSFVVFVGRFVEAKGVSLLMKAWEIFASRESSTTMELTLVGTGPLRPRVEAWAASQASVRVLGPLSHEECASVMAGARAVVVPSLWEETFGLVAVEAMAAAVAPIASYRGSLPEMITHGSDGVLFDPADPTALAEVLGDIAANPSKYEAYGQRARETYCRRFGQKGNIDELLKIYNFAIRDPVA